MWLVVIAKASLGSKAENLLGLLHLSSNVIHLLYAKPMVTEGVFANPEEFIFNLLLLLSRQGYRPSRDPVVSEGEVESYQGFEWPMEVVV